MTVLNVLLKNVKRKKTDQPFYGIYDKIKWFPLLHRPHPSVVSLGSASRGFNVIF